MMKKNPNQVTTLDVGALLAPIVGSRDVADSLAENIEHSDNRVVELDFAKVDFVSRSAAHEVLKLRNRFKKQVDHSKEIRLVKMSRSVQVVFDRVEASRSLKVSRESFNPEMIDIHRFALGNI